MSGNGAVLSEAMNALMDDERFVQATLRAAEITALTGNEAEYRVLTNGELVGPNVGSERGVSFPDSDGVFVYSGHTHPDEKIPIPSQNDLDMTDLHSRADLPTTAVWANGHHYVNGVAFRNRKPVSGTEYYLTITRKITNVLLQRVLGLDTDGFTTSKHRRYVYRCRKGFREAVPGSEGVLDVVPNALNDIGYEAVSMGLTRDYKPEGKD